MADAGADDDPGAIVPTEHMTEQVALAISAAWLVNADRVWPDGQGEPDPKALADVAATAASALFCEWIMAARSNRQEHP